MIDKRYQQALDYIFSFVNYETQRRPYDAANYDLRRMDEILERVGNPHRKVKSVHIAGSKGKGSVASMVASVLTAAGYRTGLYTSPHLLVFNERIRVNDELIPDADVVELVERIKPEVAEVNRKATFGLLTTFEVITTIGFMYYVQKNCDLNVLEVGIGGRLDATNVVLPEVSVITSISLEHTEILGKTLPEIASQKAGIIKPGVPVVVSPQTAEVDRVFEETARRNGSRLFRAGADITWQGLDFDAAQQSLRVKGRLGSYDLTIPLLGEYQLENAAVAVGALEVLIEKGYRIPEQAIVSGLANVNWPGRLQVLKRRPYVVADGAHNPYSAGKLKEALRKHFHFKRATLIIGTSSDKDIEGIVSELVPVFDRFIVTRSAHPRAMPTASLVAEFNRHGITAEVADDMATALPLALAQSDEEDLICVTGSLFVVAAAIEQMGASGSATGPRS